MESLDRRLEKRLAKPILRFPEGRGARGEARLVR